ncbi:MAG TPA: Spy/CpxP family protein refolding chaperone, partial [Caulobacteraceae bacterium]
KMRQHMEERRGRRQQVLHDALGIRADQEGAWQAFAASSHRPDGDRGPGMRHRGGEGDGQQAELTTPQRLDRMAQRMSERQARFAQRAEATKRFYAALDGRQQKTFDALVMARGGGHGMDGGWGHRGGMGGQHG